MRKIKKIFSLTVILFIITHFSGCSKSNDTENKSTSVAENSTNTTSSSPAPEVSYIPQTEDKADMNNIEENSDTQSNTMLNENFDENTLDSEPSSINEKQEPEKEVKMGINKDRVAPVISKEKLRQLLIEYGSKISEGWYIESSDDLLNNVSVALLEAPENESDADIYVYAENFTCIPGEFIGTFADKNSLIGFHTFENGLTFLGCAAGADGEIMPLFFIIYYDGDRLRVYCPKDGTIFNKRWMCTIGSEGEMMLRKYKKGMPGMEFDKKQLLEDFPEKTNIINNLFQNDMHSEEDAEEICEWYLDKDINWQKVKADIMKNIKIINRN